MTVFKNLPAVSTVVSVADGVNAPSQWACVADILREQRERVEVRLRAGERIYGFNTLLGHLDSSAHVETDQEALLKAHLAGPLVEMSERSVRLITASKLQQLAQGGSGIHPDTFTDLLEALSVDLEEPLKGSWLASYGSGDVVPAAWWVNTLRDNGFLASLHSGDVIALLNGNFVAIARSIESLELAVDFFARTSEILVNNSVIHEWSDSVPAELSAAWAALVASASGDVRSGGTQLPISSRDARPLVFPMLGAVQRLGRSVEASLNRVSANPAFVGDFSRPVSQSSFLDFELSFSLTEVRQAAFLAAGLASRLIAHICDVREREGLYVDPTWVQPPKIATALLVAASRDAIMPHSFIGDESKGVEDVRDLALLNAESLQRFINTTGQALLGLVDRLVSEKSESRAGAAAAFEHLW